MVNSLDYHPFPSRLAQGYILSYYCKLLRVLSLSRMLVELFLKLLYSTICGKIFPIYEVHIPRKCIDSRHFQSYPSHSKLATKFLSSRPRQKEISHSPRQHSFENLFPPTAEKVGGNYDLRYQNSVRKCEDDLEHQAFYILYDLHFLQM